MIINHIGRPNKTTVSFVVLLPPSITIFNNNIDKYYSLCFSSVNYVCNFGRKKIEINCPNRNMSKLKFTKMVLRLKKTKSAI